MTDWKAILVKYVKQVANPEGDAFARHLSGGGTVPDEDAFTADELDRLKSEVFPALKGSTSAVAGSGVFPSDDELKRRRRAARAVFQETTRELQDRLPQSTASTQRFGGTFAPPLTPKLVAEYRTLADQARPGVRVELLKLCDLYDLFNQTPPSSLKGVPHRSGRGTMVPLESAEIQRIWDAVPWGNAVPGDHVNEIEVLGKLFDGIDPRTHGSLRNAAYHLLWYAAELSLDREPMTSDKL